MPKIIYMATQSQPDQRPGEPDEYLDAYIFPADRYDTKQVTDLFLHLFRNRVCAAKRQATDIQLVADDEPDGNSRTLLRAVARLGGTENITAWLCEEESDDDDGFSDMPTGIPSYRDLASVEASGWDVIYHGETYPSEKENYEKAVTGFLKGEYIRQESGAAL